MNETIRKVAQQIGGGCDHLDGGSGQDTYTYNRGDGRDGIADSGEAANDPEWRKSA